jgi:DNA-binding PadR family transcriptional regulator
LLLLAEQPRHGYELAADLRLWQFRGVTPSTVYRDLARLEEVGLVRSFWEASQARGPARHMYELTPAGREDLASCATEIDGLISHLSDYLSRFSTLCADGHVQAAGPSEETPPVKARLRRWVRR